MTKILLIRHGTTEGIEQNRLHGSSETPLCKKGIIEAEKTAEFLKGQSFDALYTSSLGRALETAAIISKVLNLKPIAKDDLKERHFGLMEGKLLFDKKNKFILLKWIYSIMTQVLIAVTGESRRKFIKRITSAVMTIVSHHPEGSVIIIIHKALRNNLLSGLIDKSAWAWAKYNKSWGPCSFTEIECDIRGNARILNLASDLHLK